MSSPTFLSTSILALSFVGLSACQPATQTDEATTPDAPTVPVSESVDAPAAEVSDPQVTAPAATEAQGDTATPEGAHDHEEQDDHADHDDDADHDEHADHDDAHDHEKHADDADHADHEGHDDHDDHHDHDSAGGEAHLHGHAELALTQTGQTLSVSLLSPLANFGLSEASADLTDAQSYADNLLSLSGGACSETERHVHAKSDGQHGAMEIELTYSCTAMDSLTSATVLLFETYSGFEEIDAVLLTPTEQVAAELTAGAPTLAFP